MSYLDCADEVVSGLMDLLSSSLAGYHPKLGPDMEDMESLYQALCILRPAQIELETFDGLIKMKRGLIEEAIASLRQVTEKRDFPHAKAILAYCLFLQEEASWHGLADEVLDKNKSEGIAKLIQTIKKFDEFKKGAMSDEELAAPLVLTPNMHEAEPDCGASKQAYDAKHASPFQANASKNMTESMQPVEQNTEPKNLSTHPLPEHALRS